MTLVEPAGDGRLDAIASEKFDKLFDRLEGKAFLAQVKKAHEAYGVALNLTKAKAASAPSADIRNTLSDTLAALRDYIAQVTATVRRNKPETEALATTLLSPITNWKSRARERAPQEGAVDSPVDGVVTGGTDA